MLGDEKTDNWLLSAYEKKGASANSSDIETEPNGLGNGTAASQYTSSDGKGTNNYSDTQSDVVDKSDAVDKEETKDESKDKGKSEKKSGPSVVAKTSGPVDVVPRRKKVKMADVVDATNSNHAERGVYHDANEKCAVVSSGYMAYATEADYDASHAGHTVDKNGKEIDKGWSFPEWKALFPQSSEGLTTFAIDAQHLADWANGVADATHEGRNAVVVIRVNGVDMPFRAGNLAMFAQLAAQNGVSELMFHMDSGVTLVLSFVSEYDGVGAALGIYEHSFNERRDFVYELSEGDSEAESEFSVGEESRTEYSDEAKQLATDAVVELLHGVPGARVELKENEEMEQMFGEEGDVELMSREIESANERFNHKLDDFKNDRHTGLLHLGKPMSILKATGVNANEITLSPSILHKHLKKHNLTADDIKDLARGIQSPILVYDHGENHPNKVIVTNLNVRGSKLAISLMLNEKGDVVEISNVRSVHAKEASFELERLGELSEKQLSASIKWVDKEKVSDWLLRPPYMAERTNVNQKLNLVANVINRVY